MQVSSIVLVTSISVWNMYNTKKSKKPAMTPGQRVKMLLSEIQDLSGIIRLLGSGCSTVALEDFISKHALSVRLLASLCGILPVLSRQETVRLIVSDITGFNNSYFSRMVDGDFGHISEFARLHLAKARDSAARLCAFCVQNSRSGSTKLALATQHFRRLKRINPSYYPQASLTKYVALQTQGGGVVVSQQAPEPVLKAWQ